MAAKWSNAELDVLRGIFVTHTWEQIFEALPGRTIQGIREIALLRLGLNRPYQGGTPQSLSLQELARRFDVGRTTIRSVTKGSGWAHVNDEVSL